MMTSHIRRAFATLTLGATVAALVVTGAAGSASALGSRSINLELVDRVSAPIGANARMSIDDMSHRGYAIDPLNKSVLVYDIAGSSLTKLATIDTKLAEPTRMAIDSSTHRLIVSDQTSATAVLVDIDPASGSVNTVLKTISTGGGLPTYLALDGDIAFVGDFDTGRNISRIDLRDGSTTKYTTSRGSKSMVVNRTTHTLYVGLPGDAPGESQVMTIDSSGTAVLHPVADAAAFVDLSQGQLVISTITQVLRYDTTTWTSTAASPKLSKITGISVDDELGVIYGVTSGAMADSVALVNSATLALDGTVPTASSSSYGTTVDTSTHRLVVTGKDIELYSASPTVVRKGGADRYEVSAAISRDTFAPMAPVAYVASGAVFSDALSASAAAGALGGAVLLVQKDAIPAVIDTELKRLKPQRIVVLGGLSTIDASVETALKAYTTAVTRTGGADRYEVSAAVSHDVFGPMRPVVYIAAGSGFTDALSGSAAAGKLGGPVLLVPKDSVPDSILTEVKRLSPAKIVVLGGTASISQNVVDTLTAVQSNTVRIAGADRFEVSAAVSHSAFPTGAKTVYVASGLTYPDALSGSAAAIAKGSPILLLTPDSIPAPVATELDALNPSQIVILGGPNSISASVQESLKGFIN